MEKIKVGFEKIEGTARCACCNSFVKKQNMVQFPTNLLPMLNNPFEMGLCPKCSEKKSAAELKEVLETKYQRTMPAPKIEKPKSVANISSRKNNGKIFNGISNREMIPWLKEAIDNNDLGGLIDLQNNHSIVFQGSIKYIGKKRQAKLQELLNLELPQAV